MVEMRSLMGKWDMWVDLWVGRVEGRVIADAASGRMRT